MERHSLMTNHFPNNDELFLEFVKHLLVYFTADEIIDILYQSSFEVAENEIVFDFKEYDSKGMLENSTTKYKFIGGGEYGHYVFLTQENMI
jgi:hypothetical protein